MKIVLACNAGMSTSMLVENMKKVATNKGYSYDIMAMPQSQVGDFLAANNDVKCIILGPQIKYLLDATRELASGYEIPVGVIDMLDYGMMDGDKVLEYAIGMFEK